MAKPVTAARRAPGNKTVAAITLVVALILSIVFLVPGFTGRKMDKDGLYHLLPWIPTPSQRFLWRQALVPGADLGDTLVYTFSAPEQENQQTTGDPLEADSRILAKRLDDMGLAGAAVEHQDGKWKVTVPAYAVALNLKQLLGERGEVSFASPDGQVFLTGEHIVQSSYGQSPQDNSYSVSFSLDEEGRKIFGDKSRELIGQSISILLDGKKLASPSINQALDQGYASIPGLTQALAQKAAIMMRSGPLSQALQVDDSQAGVPLLGAGIQNRLLIALGIALILIFAYLVFIYRLSGLIAVWMLVMQLALSFFLAALLRAGFTVSTLLAVFVGFGVALHSVLILYDGMRTDIASGRSVRQALRESFRRAGHISLDVIVGLLLLCVALIIADNGMIGAFMRVLGASLLVALALVHVGLRFLLPSAMTLSGERGNLYYHPVTTKEAV